MTDKKIEQIIREICRQSALGGCPIRDHQKRDCTNKDECNFVSQYSKQIESLYSQSTPSPELEKLLLTDEEISEQKGKPINFSLGKFPETKGMNICQLSKLQPLITSLKEENKKLEQRIEELEKSEWVSIPVKSGVYWVSVFINGAYQSPRIMTVIDYGRTNKGLEVQGYCGDLSTIPVEIFCKEYYPKALWLFIPEPNYEVLKGE